MLAKHSTGKRAGDAHRQPMAVFFPVQMLFLQLATMLLATLTMYLLPLPLSAVCLSLLYVAVVWIEQRHAVFSPISLTLLAMNIALFFSHDLLDDAGYAAYSPVILFGGLFLTGTALLVAGRPASAFYGGANGLRLLHWKTSSLWVVLYGLACLAGFATSRYPGWFWIVPALMLVGALATLRLQLFDMGVAWRRPRSFDLGRYRFEQISNDASQLRTFYRHFVREAMPAIKADIGSKNRHYEQMLTLKMTQDAGTWNRTTFFLAYQDGQVVGTISCLLDRSAVPLPLEQGHSDPIDLQRVRAYGRLVEVGRFSIAKEHRLGQDVIQGLLRCAVEFALEQDAAFLVAQSYLSALPIYHKIGFHALNEKSVCQNTIGTTVKLLGFNLARRVICEADKAQMPGKLHGILSPYLAERYFKRQALRALFRKKQAWQLSDDDLAALVLQGAPQGRT